MHADLTEAWSVILPGRGLRPSRPGTGAIAGPAVPSAAPRARRAGDRAGRHAR
jgi:hypothetical protein